MEEVEVDQEGVENLVNHKDHTSPKTQLRQERDRLKISMISIQLK